MVANVHDTVLSYEKLWGGNVCGAREWFVGCDAQNETTDGFQLETRAPGRELVDLGVQVLRHKAYIERLCGVYYLW